MKKILKKEAAGLCERFCMHIQAGFTDESFPECGLNEIKSLMQKYPRQMKQEMIKAARRQRLKWWEENGMGIGHGEVKPMNASMWAFNMRHRYGWRDKPEEKLEGELEQIDIIHHSGREDED
jgi:hypothetical protein